MAQSKKCPECSLLIPSDAPSGLCPQCLLKQGMAEETPPPIVILKNESHREPFKLGEVIGGKYEVRSVLGKGGFGLVYLVYDEEHQVSFAIKTLRDEHLSDEAAHKAFREEAYVWTNLGEHPFIVSAWWVEEFSGRIFVCIDHVPHDQEGRTTLKDHLLSSANGIDLDLALKWAVQFCYGMEHANANGVKAHCDIKPANIMIMPDLQLKFTDFGMARIAQRMWHDNKAPITFQRENSSFGFSLIETKESKICGTPGYIAPEVYRGEVADVKSDIYSFGLVLWQMAAGNPLPPFTPQSCNDINEYVRIVYKNGMDRNLPKTNSPLDFLIERCLAPSPSERFHNFEDLRGELETLLFNRTSLSIPIPAIGERTVDFWNNRGASLSCLGMDTEAIRCYDRALEIDSNFIHAWMNKGNAMIKFKKDKEAINYFDHALTIDSQNPTAWLGRGNALANTGMMEAAISCFDHCLIYDPAKVSALFNKGTTLADLGRHEEAIASFSKASLIDKRHDGAWINRANSLHSLGRHQEAVECCDRALDINPLSSFGWNTKGASLNELGLIDEAIECYDRSLELNPKSSQVWYRKGLGSATQGNLDEALRCYGQAIRLNPKNVDALINKGSILHEIKKYEEAITCYAIALKIEDDAADIWFNKGLAEEALGLTSEAASSFQQYLTLNESHHSAYTAYAKERIPESRD